MSLRWQCPICFFVSLLNNFLSTHVMLTRPHYQLSPRTTHGVLLTLPLETKPRPSPIKPMTHAGHADSLVYWHDGRKRVPVGVVVGRLCIRRCVNCAVFCCVQNKNKVLSVPGFIETTTIIRRKWSTTTRKICLAAKRRNGIETHRDFAPAR
jgi:hypothetical protein